MTFKGLIGISLVVVSIFLLNTGNILIGGIAGSLFGFGLYLFVEAIVNSKLDQ